MAKSHTVAVSAGPVRVDALAAKLPPRSWQRLSAGAGAKGHRWYDWAWIAIEPGRLGCHWLLIRRNRHTRELAFYRCWSPRQVPSAALVRVAGIRWSAEENFAAGKGLDEHQVRRWTSRYRWATLATLARAFLTVAAAAEHAQPPPAGMIPLTRNEIAHLAAALTPQPARAAGHRLRWSTRRRHHQHTAQTRHYLRQSARDP